MKPVAAVVLLLAGFASAGSQNTGPRVPPSSTSGSASSEASRVYRTTGARIAIGRNVHVPVDEEVNNAVVVVAGSARIDGRVRDGVVVVGGNLDFGPRADVRGEIVVVGGRVRRDAGAQVRGPITDISIGEWRSWTLGGVSLPIVDFGDVGRWLSLFGTVFRVALLALLMGVFILVARAPVARIGRSAAAEPGRAFALGLIAELLFVPALIVATVSLIITIIGIPLVIVLLPVAVLGAFIALLLGFTALACRIGEWVEDRMGWRAHSALLAMSIGLLLIVAPTVLARMIGVAPEPMRWAALGLLAAGIIVEFVVWTMGLGATLMTGFGRWSTVPPPPPPVAQPSILPATN
jgi:hypothetical protein